MRRSNSFHTFISNAADTILACLLEVFIRRANLLQTCSQIEEGRDYEIVI